MPYSPWVTYRGDQYLASGINQFGNAVAQALQQYTLEKERDQAATSAAEAALRPALDSEQGYATARAAIGDKLLQKFVTGKATRQDKLAIVNAMQVMEQRAQRDQENQFRKAALGLQQAGVDLDAQRAAAAQAHYAATEAHQRRLEEQAAAAARRQEELAQGEDARRAATARFLLNWADTQGLGMTREDADQIDPKMVTPIIEKALATRGQSEKPNLQFTTDPNTGQTVATYGNIALRLDKDKPQADTPARLTQATDEKGNPIEGLYMDSAGKPVHAPRPAMGGAGLLATDTLRTDLANVEKEIAALEKEVAMGNQRTGPDWLPWIATPYVKQLEGLRAKRASLLEALARLTKGQATSDAAPPAAAPASPPVTNPMPNPVTNLYELYLRQKTGK